MVGGDPYEAWLEGTKLAYKPPESPDEATKPTSPLSPPAAIRKTRFLYQGSKCYDPPDVATKKGGIIITMMEASDI